MRMNLSMAAVEDLATWEAWLQLPIGIIEEVPMQHR